ncbi:MAG: hypothetical protein V1887_02255 [Candidatus Aenigmatarchaeota archaeon]
MANIRELLRPDWKKALLCLMLFGLSLFYKGAVFADAFSAGLPLEAMLFSFGASAIGSMLILGSVGVTLYFGGLIADLVVWYLVAVILLSLLVPRLKRHKK